MDDLTTNITGADDTVLTTASTMTQPDKKTKGRKGTATKNRKTRAKEEDIEMGEIAPPATTAATKPKRGKKRGSEAIEESTVSEVPATKRRTIRDREASVDPIMTATEDSDVSIAPSEEKKSSTRKGRASKVKAGNRKVSARSHASLASATSLAASLVDFPDDDEIERQLQADLDRLSDDEIAADSDSERSRSQTAKPEAAQSLMPVPNSNYAMFDPRPMEADEAAVEDELQMLQAEMEVDEPEQQLHIPKKERKAGIRKVSKQTKAKKTKTPSPPPKEVAEPQPELDLVPEAQQAEPEEQDVSVGSTDTVVKKEVRESTEPRKRGRPSKASLASSSSFEMAEPAQPVEQPVKRGRGRPSKASLEPTEVSAVSQSIGDIETQDEATKKGRGRLSKNSTMSQNSVQAGTEEILEPPVKRGRGRPPKKSLDAQQSKEETDQEEAHSSQAIPAKVQQSTLTKKLKEATVVYSERAQEEMASSSVHSTTRQQCLELPSTPGKIVSTSIAAKQAVLSPSQSPQSSDAENQPPSSKATGSVTTKRVALEPVAATPMRDSPSKRNILAGLQSSTPWSAVDLDIVLGTPKDGAAKENGLERLLRKGKELTSPEKGMTVEEWIYFNASQAEKELKYECEAMVNRFECEGTRAMRVLEGIHAYY